MVEFAEGYRVEVIGRGVEVTDAMKAYAEEKITKIERFTNGILDVVITLAIQKTECRCDVLVKVGHTVIKVSQSGDEMYQVIDLASDKLKRKITRWRERLKEHHETPINVVDMNVHVLETSEVDEINDEIIEENLKRAQELFKPHEIVARETMPLKILTYDEAVMKMELSEAPFMVFRNEEDNKLKVIYRREDENFGIIEPE